MVDEMVDPVDITGTTDIEVGEECSVLSSLTLTAPILTESQSDLSSKNNQIISSPTSLDDTVLSESEEKAIQEFLRIVNASRQGKTPLSRKAGIKFLMARKFNIKRSTELYNQHYKVRIEEGLINLNPNVDPLKTELLSGKFTVLPTRDLGGAAIAVFTARLHHPSAIPHEHTLQGLVYQLDAALEDPQTQRCGLVFVYDMYDSKYSHFDYELSIKILTLLKGSYPARLKKVLIVTAPLWFRAPFRILRLFVREKLRYFLMPLDESDDRVFTVSLPQLRIHIPNPALPSSLGGLLEVNHPSWLISCKEILSTTDLWGITVGEKLLNMAGSTQNSKENLNSSSGDANGHSVVKKQRRNGQSSPLPNSGSSGFSDDDSLPDKSGLSLLEFVEHLKQKGRRGLLDEYSEIVSKTPEGTFTVSKQRVNTSKNRYSDVLCFDHTRVVLSQDPDAESDYINANYVDGYKQKNAFISTQGPLPKTFGDFWKMVWEQVVVVIVMTTRVLERGRIKCGQYWPTSGTTTYEGFTVENKSVETFPDYSVTRLLVTNVKSGEERDVVHLQFLSWPDYGVPSSAAAMLQFLHVMRQEQKQGVNALKDWDGNALGPPIIAHCSAGIGRTGTLITIDISIKRLQDQGTMDVQGTVEKIRAQRAHSIQVPEQYLFCHAAMVEYARNMEMLSEQQVDGVDDLLQDSSDKYDEVEKKKGKCRIL